MPLAGQITEGSEVIRLKENCTKEEAFRPALLRLRVGVAYRLSAFLVLSNFELLLENWSSSAYPLPFQGNIYFDTVGDLNEGNILVHPVVFAIEGHRAINASGG